MSKPTVRLRIHEEFSIYRTEVMPSQAGPAQVEECRLAFYAGAVSMRRILLNLADMDDVNPQSAATAMEDLEAELREFPKRMRAAHTTPQRRTH